MGVQSILYSPPNPPTDTIPIETQGFQQRVETGKSPVVGSHLPFNQFVFEVGQDFTFPPAPQALLYFKLSLFFSSLYPSQSNYSLY